MGNHRADRRDHGRRPSDLATPARAAGGKRRAEKQSRRSSSRAVENHASTIAPVLREDEETLVLPATRDVPEALAERPSVYETSRLGGVRATYAPRTAPSKPGARRSSSRPPLFRMLPSAPMALGLVALAISAGGAVTVTGGLEEEAPRISQASALSGDSEVATASMLDRRTVSRDSRRDARSDAAAAELQDEVEAQSRERNESLAQFAAQAQKHADKLRLNQWVVPISGYRLTAEYGDYGLWANYHTGLDFAAPTGTPLMAIANGTITSVGSDGAYGTKTVLTLDDGTEIWYCHQSSTSVSVGQQVRAGDLIGAVGSTGHVTGPHLHLEVRPGGGDPVDPYAAMVVNGVTP